MIHWRAGVIAALLASSFWLAVLTQPANLDLEIREPGWSHDFLRYYRPNAEYAAMRWASGEPPLWNPRQGFGAPFLATLQPAAIYPPNVLHLALDSQHAFVALAALHLAWAAFAMAGLAGALGSDRVGATAAGLLYALSVSVVGAVWTPTTLYAASWLPAVLWAVDAVCRRPDRRHVTALAAATALQALTGWIYVVVMTALAAALYGFGVLVGDAVRQRRLPWRTVLALAAGAGTGVLLAAPLLLPARELVGASTRAVGTLIAAQATGAGLHDPAELWSQMLRHGTIDAVSGWGALALALLALALPGAGRGRTALLVGIGLLALGVSFPMHLPLYDALRELPLLGDFRFPYRYRLVTSASLCAAAGVGLTHLGALLARRLPGLAPSAAVAVLTLVVAAQAIPLSRGLTRFPRSAAPPSTPAQQLAEAGVDLLDPPRARTLWSGLSRRTGDEVLYTVNDLEPLTLATTARLLNHFQLGRPLTVLPSRVRPRPGEDAPPAAPFYGMVALPPSSDREPLLDLASVQRVVARDTDGWWQLRYPRESRPDAELPVYRNPDALPRAYRVHQAIPEPSDPRIAVRRLVSPGFDARRMVMLSPLPVAPPRTAAAAAAPESTRIERYEEERVVVHTAGPTPAILVLTEAHFPGWEVRVDGVPAELLRANTAFRAVLVPEGAHDVEFRYRPASWRHGWALAALAALGLMASWVRPRRS